MAIREGFPSTATPLRDLIVAISKASPLVYTLRRWGVRHSALCNIPEVETGRDAPAAAMELMRHPAYSDADHPQHAEISAKVRAVFDAERGAAKPLDPTCGADGLKFRWY